jgi:RNA polymerase sigma-70 factor (ECF subfamily)
MVVEGQLLVKGTESRAGATDDYVAAARANVDDAYRLAGYLLGDAAEAQDAVQEALVKAWRNWSSLRDVEAFRPWFKRILINVCYDRMRARRKIVDLEAAADLESKDTFAAMLAGDEVARAVGRLGRDQRTVVVLRFWSDMTLDQIGETLGLPLGTVKSRLHYALRALKAELGDSFNEA